MAGIEETPAHRPCDEFGTGQGHSFGSLIVQSFAARQPDHVAGVVHIDASLPGMALWPDYGPLIDGPGAHATSIDATAGAAELAGETMPDVPAVVLARTPGRWRSPRADATVDQTWRDNQADLARILHAPLIVAADSGHDIPGEAPDLVAFAIDEVVRATRHHARRVLLDPAKVRAAGGNPPPAPGSSPQP